MRYFVRFAYYGTPFHGSQSQPEGTTVQQVLEQAFSTILRCPVALTFAGRTDAGVHALEMYAHFDYPSSLNSKLLSSKLNSLLPSAIAVYDIFPVADSAHARFSAVARTYQYHITQCKDPFNLHLRTYVAPGLDFDAMNRAAALLVGRHDFASFCKVHTDVKTTFCTVTEAYWQPLPPSPDSPVHRFTDSPLPQFPDSPVHQFPDSPISYFTITADRFLRNMVRAVVGTLFDVGRHKLSIDDFQSVIDARNRCSAGQSAPPDGLYLTHIAYTDL
ncbi:MAG: tRNA pseudouridine(38-40) synthase TruA [Paludibacteraceae bacterium]|nr:tRNA pseudouridine(38-40) synthase TruA [Paludibacteraceae bacterium]